MNIGPKLEWIALAAIIALMSLSVNAQDVIKPNYGLKNPETLEVIRVRVTGGKTLVDLSIQNMVRDGYFCIDRNTFLEYDDGQKIKLEEVKGLPLCPDIYEFASVGERVYFTLVFDRIPEDLDWFDIVEYCNGNCFSVLALNMDKGINEKVDAAFNAMDRLDPEEAIDIFTELLPAMEASGHGLTGSVYLNLVELLAANNRKDELSDLIKDFKTSPLPHKEKYLNILSVMGY